MTSVTTLLSQLKQQGLYRSRCLSARESFALNFSSSDYLSLAADAGLRQALKQGIDRYPLGSTASLAISGYSPIHKTVESAFAQLLGAEDALLFSSGYAANLAIVALVAKLNHALFIDKSIHASFYDGIRLANLQPTRFLHNNFADLQRKLTQAIAPTEADHLREAMVAVETIYSMSGLKPDLPVLASLCTQHQVACIFDESHAFGVVGPRGAGLAAQAKFPAALMPLRIISFGKTLAAQGAVVVGLAEWIEALFQVGRSVIYSTALSPVIAYGVLQSLDWVIKADARRARLAAAIAYFQTKIEESRRNYPSLVWRTSETAIQQLQLGCPQRALRYAAHLRAQGILCAAIRQPTVTAKETGLRILLNACHEPKDIDQLFASLGHLQETE